MELPKRKQNRLTDYDYSQPNAYFITICTKDKRYIFWEPVGASIARPDTVPLSAYGKIVEEAIKNITTHYPMIFVDNYVVMPNHIHFILRIKSGGASTSPTISDVVRTFKSLTMRECRANGFNGETLFQRSFHDHIIRNDADYLKIWNYIDTNPAKWNEDCFYIE